MIRVNRRSAPATSWTPADLGSSLQLWLVAAAANLSLSGSEVLGWSDLSSNARTLSPTTSADRPTWQSTGWPVGSLGAVYFDGTDELTTAIGSAIAMNNFTLSVCFQETAIVTNGGVATLHTGTGNDYNGNNSAGSFYVAAPNIAFNQAAYINGGTSPVAAGVYTHHRVSGSSKVWKNATSGNAVSASQNGTPTYFSLGRRQLSGGDGGSSYRFQGRIRAVVLVSGAVSDANLALLIAYMRGLSGT